MPLSAILLLLMALFGSGWNANAYAGKKTVCTITVNSPDEKAMFRQRLPEDQYQFVELVERGRTDWLASACRQGIQCDVLVISGHFDGSTEFYSDQVAAQEFLPVAEMERASCSASCPGLFSRLKEVYLFGCNTLSADAVKSVSSEVGRSLMRSGYSQAAAQRRARSLDERHGESSRDRMRRIFMNVPVIYGFSSVAPLGPTAAARLGRYFQSASLAEFGSGRASSRLLAHFAGESMIAVGGLVESDPRASHRSEVCRFIDDRAPAAEKLAFIHELLRRDMAEVRMFLERIEGFFASLDPSDERASSFARAREAIAQDSGARSRYLRFTEDADEPQIRARMIQLAGTLGWLTAEEQRAELARMIGEILARDAGGSAAVDLVCSLNKSHELDQERHRLLAASPRAAGVTYAAGMACLGDAGSRNLVLQALLSPDDADVQIAEVYLGHRPITDVGELRVVATGIARMSEPGAQVRALDTLSRHRVSDRQSLDVLARLFPATESVDVQRAIAAVFIRADYQMLPKPEMVRVFSQSRLKSNSGDDIIDILIRRLQMP